MEKRIEINGVYRLTVCGYSSEGLGIARIDGLVVFIKNAVRGEVCDVKLIKLTNTYAYGIIEKIITQSPHRIKPECPYFGLCGGCDFWHLNYDEELWLKKARVYDALSRIGGHSDIQIEIIGAKYTNSYRNKALYPVAEGKDGGVVTGFYRARSHEVIPIKRCLIQNEAADRLAAAAGMWMERFNIPPYDMKSGSGLVRHIYVRTSRASGKALLCMVANARRLPHTGELCKMALEACPELTGVVLSVNKKAGNADLGGLYITLWGDGYLEDELLGLRFRISPRSFYQINPHQTRTLYEKAIEFAGLTGGETVLDLYCGIGTIALCMAKSAGYVTGFEIMPEAIEDAKINAALNSVQNAGFICGDAAKISELLPEYAKRPNVVVADPPRKGLSESVIAEIVKIKPERIVYISCDPATMARDIKKLESGGYGLIRAAAVDMFCRTSNIETVCLLTENLF